MHVYFRWSKHKIIFRKYMLKGQDVRVRKVADAFFPLTQMRHSATV